MPGPGPPGTPDRQVVFFAVGFETTAPANALALALARRQRVANFSMLVSHVLVPPAIETLLSSPRNRVQGFLAAGHVCTVMGYGDYEPLARRFQVPFVVTGFEPLDLLQGILMCLQQLEEGRWEVQNQYTRSVSAHGNRKAQDLIGEVFHVVPRRWRGLGEIPSSGLGIRPEWGIWTPCNASLWPRRAPKAPRSVELGRCCRGSFSRNDVRPSDYAAHLSIPWAL